MFQRRDAGSDTGTPVQGALERASLVVLRTLARRASARRQSHVLHSQRFPFALVLGGKETAVRGGHRGGSAKVGLMLFHGGGKKAATPGIALPPLGSAHPGLPPFTPPPQPAALRRSLGSALAYVVP